MIIKFINGTVLTKTDKKSLNFEKNRRNMTGYRDDQAVVAKALVAITSFQSVNET